MTASEKLGQAMRELNGEVALHNNADSTGFLLYFYRRKVELYAFGKGQTIEEATVDALGQMGRLGE